MQLKLRTTFTALGAHTKAAACAVHRGAVNTLHASGDFVQNPQREAASLLHALGNLLDRPRLS